MIKKETSDSFSYEGVQNIEQAKRIAIEEDAVKMLRMYNTFDEILVAYFFNDDMREVGFFIGGLGTLRVWKTPLTWSESAIAGAMRIDMLEVISE